MLRWLFRVYNCQNVKLLELSCRVSIYLSFHSLISISWKRGLYRIWVVLSFLPFVCQSARPFVSPSYFFRFRSISWELFYRIYPLYVHWYWHDLAWDCYASFSPNLYQSYGPWFTPKFRFRPISWERMDIISPNFIYAFILTRSSLGLLRVIFPHLYQSYGPWFTPKFRFAQWLENILT